jgi:sarcosine oxidase subunit alpha
MTAPASELRHGCWTDPARPLAFTFEGRTIPAVHGQTIAAALYAAGVRIFTRSFKYHRPRGLLCVSGDCPNCLMQVDGRPNVRTCTEPVRQGQVVSGQNAWPSLQFDLLRTFDRLHAFLPVGFYYKRFHKPRWLWPVFEHVVRHVAGLGRIDVQKRPEAEPEVEHLHAEVCVVGAGPAGLAAAAAAAEAGADVLLVEREPHWGGHLLYEGQGGDIVETLGRGLRDRSANVRVLRETTAFGLYEGNLIGAFQRDRLLKIRAGQIIVCTGGRQRPFLFSNNDLPGIFLGRGVLRLARLYGVRAGKRTVVLTDNDDGHRLAEQLAALGIAVAAIVDPRPAAGSLGHNFTVLPAHTVVRARGGSHLRAIEVAPANETGGSGHKIDCDLLCLASRLVPANELLHQGGMRFAHDGGRWVPNRIVPGLLAAGAAAGTFGLDAQVQEGRRRGRQAAGRSETEDGQPLSSTPHSPFPLPPPAGKCFVCVCEDVTVKDLGQAVAEGFDHLETLKRYATVGMGPCQGKMCGAAATEVCSRLTGREIGALGTTTSRPPVVPVELAVLAAERRHQPVRRTPLHHWHEAAGARWLDAGQWKRPESYGDPAEEVRAVRTRAGLIDVSTLGKVEVLGPDAAELLERVYLNEWANLAVGRARYGVMCSEEGIVFDDGVGARLGPEHFYLTATTGNAEAVFQWLELWRTTWRLKATVLNQTSAFAAVNAAGPRAREVLGRLTTLDLSTTAFPYPALRSAEVAGVQCRLLRVGFVGELGFEIHCAAAHGWHLWEALLAAGSDFGIRPFGVEAQRTLRLEKGRLIVGQDTDALSNPFGAGLGRMVRFTKPLFHGREALLRLKERGLRTRLVGFHLPDGAAGKGDAGWARRLEGCQVVEEGRPVGRVTSARHSPTLDCYIGLAWVPAARSAPGTSFLIRCNDADLPALIAPLPFYDPEGERLKS